MRGAIDSLPSGWLLLVKVLFLRPQTSASVFLRERNVEDILSLSYFAVDLFRSVESLILWVVLLSSFRFFFLSISRIWPILAIYCWMQPIVIFNFIIFQAVGMTPGGSSSLSLLQNKMRQGDRFWVLPGEKIQIEGLLVTRIFYFWGEIAT